MKRAPDDSLHQFAKKNIRVKLREDKADVYSKAYAGSEAVIRELGIDVGDFPMVYIEWDKKHWLYNGESDMWTFESHFEPVKEEAVMSDKDKNDGGQEVLKYLADLLKPMLEKEGAKSEPEPEPFEEKGIPVIPTSKGHDLSLPVVDNADDYIEALSEAFDVVSESQAFLVIAIKPMNNPMRPGEEVLLPESFMAYSSEEAGYTLHLAISEVASATHAEAIARILHDKFNREHDEP